MRNKIRLVSLRHYLYALALMLMVLFAKSASAKTLNIPLMPSIFKTSCPLEGGNDQISFDIDKSASILIKLNGVAGIKIKYESEGYFRLNYITAENDMRMIDPKYLMGRTVFKGKGTIDINLRHTLQWSQSTYPVLIFSGTGKFIITSLEVVTTSGPEDYIDEKNSAFFWRPESFRSSLMNSITPVFWNVNNQTLWTPVLGKIAFISLLIFILICNKKKKPATKYIPLISLFFMLIFALHFVVRFIPMLHLKFYLSSNEKIKMYYPLPEFGELAAEAREILKPTDKVLVMTDEMDWFAPKALCFNISPIPCVFYDTNYTHYPHYYSGINDTRQIKPDDINVVVSYYSKKSVPDSYDLIYKLNKNVFIVKKK